MAFTVFTLTEHTPVLTAPLKKLSQGYDCPRRYGKWTWVPLYQKRKMPGWSLARYRLP